MLALKRLVNESVILTILPSTETRTVEVKLCDTGNGWSRIGIEADRSINIVRAELLDATHREPGSEASRKQRQPS